MSAVQSKEPFLRYFDDLDRTRPAAAFQSLRQAGRSKFRELSLPTQRTEDWRFTSTTALVQTPFELAPGGAIDANQLPPLSEESALRLCFVNGTFVAELSRVAPSPNGLSIGNLATAPAEQTQKLAQLADFRDQPFTALNTGLLADGAVIVVADGAVIEQPIEILHVTDAQRTPSATNPRVLIVAGKNSSVRVFERFLAVGASTRPYFTNAVTEIAVGPNADVDHIKVQDESTEAYHVANTQVVLQRSSRFTTHYVGLGGRLARNEVRARFEDEGGEATVNGLYLASGTQHLDNFTVIDHARPNCASHELYKGILRDQAHGVFNGKIFVRPGAQKTDAKQTNKALLLSDRATIDTKPQLEIFADDVKCTHGATIGQLDADQLFYLRARGLGLEQARSLLTFAFANDIIQRIKLAAVRDQLEQLIVR